MTTPPAALITRQDAAPLERLLRGHGLGVVHIPLFKLVPTRQPPPRPRPTLALVSSATSTQHAPNMSTVLSGARVVAVGQKTAAALRAAGIVPAAVGESGGAEAVALLRSLLRPDDRVGYVGAVRISAPLLAALSALPVPVARWDVYDNLIPSEAARLPNVSVSVVTLTSPTAARRFVALGGDTATPAVTIGATTTAEAQAVGLTVAAVAAVPSMEELAAAAAWVCAQLPRK